MTEAGTVQGTVGRGSTDMSEALQVISNEHRGMWRVTVALDELRQQVRDPAEKPDAELFHMIFDYIEAYIDRVHHPKENDYLFKIMRRRSAAPEVEALLAEFEGEHGNSPNELADLRGTLQTFVDNYPEGADAFCASVEYFINRVRRHIMKEEAKLFPAARKILQEEDWAELEGVFCDDRDPQFGEQVQAEFRRLLSQIVNYAPAPIGLGLPREERRAAPAPVAGSNGAAILEVHELASHYGRIQALHGVSLEVREGELVALVGANGAGKTTLLRTLSGVQRASAGRIGFGGKDITRMRADLRVRQGICQVPEGRQVFGPMSVEDNLRLGACTRKDAQAIETDLEAMYAMFPILKQKRHEAAGTLSGGQQQMLAMARALMGRPRLLLLDEPSMGLAPLLVEEIFNAIIGLRQQGKTIFLVEQNAQAALSVADRAYVLETGNVVLSGTGHELLANEQVRAAYLGM